VLDAASHGGPATDVLVRATAKTLPWSLDAAEGGPEIPNFGADERQGGPQVPHFGADKPQGGDDIQIL